MDIQYARFVYEVQRVATRSQPEPLHTRVPALQSGTPTRFSWRARLSAALHHLADRLDAPHPDLPHPA